MNSRREPSVITLTTDFGIADAYVGLMKAAVLSINPYSQIVDISHSIYRQSVISGAFIFGNSYHFFPENTIHVVVVDPGVGTTRELVVAMDNKYLYLAPDNGILSPVIKNAFSGRIPDTTNGFIDVPDQLLVYKITNNRYWTHPVSSTFHGRDILAPVAAHLSLGLPPSEMGEPVRSLEYLDTPRLIWESDRLDGKVMHLDHFGNIITNIGSNLVRPEQDLRIHVGKEVVRGVSANYRDNPGLLALIGSSDTLEISVTNGNAAESLGISIGDSVFVVRKNIS